MGNISQEAVETKMQLAGELAKMNLGSLLRLVRNGELSGKICLTRGADTAFIHFSTGRPIFVETDYGNDREALLELFLWQTGSFSYSESSAQNTPITLPEDEPLEKLLKDGNAYNEAIRYLEQLRINSRTIFRSTETSSSDPLLSQMNSRATLGEIVQALKISRRDYVVRLRELIAAGKALVVEPASSKDKIQLPDWVISRLKQDNPDVSQAIIQMVIWADRVKCWLYQADVDLQRVITAMENPEISDHSANFAENSQESFHPQESVLEQEIASNMNSYEQVASPQAQASAQTQPPQVQPQTQANTQPQNQTKTQSQQAPADPSVLGPPSPPSYEF